MRLALFSILAGTFALAGSAGAQPQAKPSLRLIDRDPLIVRGAGFEPGERVLVTLTLGDKRRPRGVIAKPLGGFTLRFDGVRLDACMGATLVAIGRRSDIVTLKIGLRECPGPVLDP